MTSIDDIRPKVGNLSPTLRKANAWWVGTDAAQDRITEYDRQHEEWAEKVRVLCERLDCDPKRVWRARIWGDEILTALTPNNPDHLAPGLRLDKGDRSKVVPNLRTKAGKAIDTEMRAITSQPTPLKAIGGVTGSVDVSSGRNDGSFYSHHGQVIIPTDATHPILVLPVDPSEDTREWGGPFEVDDDLWERTPLSILHALIEEQEVRP